MQTYRSILFAGAALSAIAAWALAIQCRHARGRWEDETALQMRELTEDVSLAVSSDCPPLGTSPSPAMGALPPPVQRHLQSALWPGGEGVTSEGDAGEGLRDDEAPLALTTIKTLRIEQEGTFLVNGGRWVPFEATQLFSADPAHPSFVWDAKMYMPFLPPALERAWDCAARWMAEQRWTLGWLANARAMAMRPPSLRIDVRDSYVRGVGRMVAEMAGIGVTLADEEDGPMINEGEVMRWLAESVLFPTSWIARPVHRCSGRGGDDDRRGDAAAKFDEHDGGGIQWLEDSEQDGEHSAVAEISFPARQNSSSTALVTRVEFRFDESTGLLSSVYAERPMATPAGRGEGGDQEDGGGAVRTPWEGHMRNYRRFGGVLVPTQMEVGWWKDGELEIYFKGENTQFEYEFADL